MKRVVIYARVSTSDQQTLPLQVKAMQEYATHRGWQIVREVQEKDSGAKKLPLREEIMKLAKQRQIDTIIVWKLDRWGRSLVNLINELNELNALGVGFVSLTEALDFTTPSGKAMAGMLAVFAEFERDMVRERVKAGIEHARAKGGKHGRPTISNYKVQKVLALKKAKKNISEIARQVKISRTSVRRILNKKS